MWTRCCAARKRYSGSYVLRSQRRARAATTLPRVSEMPFEWSCMEKSLVGGEPKENGISRDEFDMQSVIDTIPAMVVCAFPDGSLEFLNQGWREYTGSRFEDLVRWGWQSVIHADDLTRFSEEWSSARTAGKPFRNEVRIRRADGRYCWFSISKVPLRDENDQIVRWYGTAFDIEERKQAEQERERLRQLEADLAHINRVSTLGEMAASLAHEIKQPIAAAITSSNACLQWLAHDPPNVIRARAAAIRIEKDGARAAEIIDRIRSFYKKSPPQRELIDINDIIREMLVLLHCEATRYAIEMRTELYAELPKIMADRVQLQQVFMNLMLNGIEAMEDSGGELLVSSQLQPDGQLLFSVSDAGVGLPTEKMELIFSAFNTTKSQGSGMGLAISRSIIESHGGRIWAASKDGLGATFHFTLPTK